MNVRIEERPTFKVVGVKEEISLKDGANLLEIPKFWERVNLDGTANKISDLSHGELGGLVGICTNMRDQRMDYWIGVATTEATPLEFEEVVIEAQIWAVFEVVGPLPTAIQAAWKFVFSEWLPHSDYFHAEGPEVEWYSIGNPTAENYVSEIWIPIMMKEATN